MRPFKGADMGLKNPEMSGGVPNTRKTWRYWEPCGMMMMMIIMMIIMIRTGHLVRPPRMDFVL